MNALRFATLVVQASTCLAFRIAQASPVPNLPVEEYHLANGLQVVLAPDDSLPDVALALRYDVGSADDPNGLEGLAHLVEHIHFMGSAHVARGDHARLLEAAGAWNVQGHTSQDSTFYTETVPPEALELALWLESERMGLLTARLDEAAITHEQVITAHEYRDRVFDAQLGLLAETLSNEVFPAWHPYHIPDSPLAAIGQLRLRDVQAFVRTWYTAGNARLVLAGHFDPHTALALVTRYLAGLPAGNPPKRLLLPASWRLRDVVVDVNAAVSHRQVMALWLTPRLHDRGDRELDLAARILAGPNGLLVRELVGRGMAASVAARQYSRRRASTFAIGVALSDGQKFEPVGRVIEDALAKVAFGRQEAETANARQWWSNARFLGIETSSGRAARLAEADDFADPWDLSAYARINSAAVADAARTFLVPERRVAAVVYPSTRPLPPLVRAVIESREQRLP